MSDLERRYRALLRWYPAEYRTERADEIVATYLEVAGARRRPSIADTVDVLRGAVRQHLRARHSLGLVEAVPLAATLALTAATVLAVSWLVLAELGRSQAYEGSPAFGVGQPIGPFLTLGAVVWILWLVAGCAAVFGAGRPFVLVALASTVAVIPAAAFTAYARPPLLVLVPQLALGLIALGLRRRRRLLPLLAGLAAGGCAGYWRLENPSGGWYYELLGLLPGAAGLLLLAVVVLGVRCIARADRRGWWPVLLLLGPGLLLVVNDVARALPSALSAGQTMPAPIGALIVTSAAVSALALGALPVTVGLRGRLVATAERCPSCGR